MLNGVNNNEGFTNDKTRQIRIKGAYEGFRLLEPVDIRKASRSQTDNKKGVTPETTIKIKLDYLFWLCLRYSHDGKSTADGEPFGLDPEH